MSDTCAAASFLLNAGALEGSGLEEASTQEFVQEPEDKEAA